MTYEKIDDKNFKATENVTVVTNYKTDVLKVRKADLQRYIIDANAEIVVIDNLLSEAVKLGL